MIPEFQNTLNHIVGLKKTQNKPISAVLLPFRGHSLRKIDLNLRAWYIFLLLRQIGRGLNGS